MSSFAVTQVPLLTFIVQVRIGRQERRARRRARQHRVDDPSAAGGDDDVDVQVNVAVDNSDDLGSLAPPTPSNEGAPSRRGSMTPATTPATIVTSTVTTGGTELASESARHGPFIAAPGGDERDRDRDKERDKAEKEEDDLMGAYTTFQQLGFAPAFPLATIADECIIPPSFPEFLRHREEYEGTGPEEGIVERAVSVGTSPVSTPVVQNEVVASVAVAPVGLSPPGLPTPLSQPPTRWFYRDPKGVVQGMCFMLTIWM